MRLQIYIKYQIYFFPSIYEGYGLPLVEAMKCGLPIVCSNNSSIPEIVNDAVLSSEHDNVKFFVENIYKILSDHNIKTLYSTKSINRSKYFNLEDHNRQILNLYKRELKKKNYRILFFIFSIIFIINKDFNLFDLNFFLFVIKSLYIFLIISSF